MTTLLIVWGIFLTVVYGVMAAEALWHNRAVRVNIRRLYRLMTEDEE